MTTHTTSASNARSMTSSATSVANASLPHILSISTGRLNIFIAMPSKNVSRMN